MSTIAKDSLFDWKALIDNFPDQIAHYDREYKHLYVNHALKKEIQLSAGQVLGKSNRDLAIPSEERALNELEATIDSVFQTKQPAELYTQQQYPEGMHYYVMKFIPQFDEACNVESVWAITREITFLMQSEEKLKDSQVLFEKKYQELTQVNEIQQTLLYTIAHDLRNPLANIKAISELLKEAEKEQVPILTQLLANATQRLDDVLAGLTDIMEKKSGQQIHQQYELSSIHALIQTEFNNLLTEAKASISSDFSACPSLYYPKAYLESLFRNMISNAIKYRAANRPLKIEISSERKEGFVVIVFKDNGQGIDLNQYREKLFSAFFRISHEKQGKGIGLHIVKRIVEENAGRLEVESQVGVGTTFTCWLKERKE